MNLDGGYTRQFRRLWDNPIFRSKQEAAVFSWMKDAAQWRETRYSTKFGPVILGVGELLIAERVLADDFGLHRNTLRTLIQRMADDGMIEVFKDRCPHRAGTVIRIVKYKEYQSSDSQEEYTQDRSGTVNSTEEGPKKDRSETKNKEDKESNKGKDSDSPQLGLLPQAQDDSDLAIQAWNELAADVGLSIVKTVNPSRRKHLRARLKDAGGLPGWKDAIARIRRSPFLMGKKTDWRADFDFVLQQKSFTKLMEGGYDAIVVSPPSPQQDRETVNYLGGDE